MPRCRRAWLKVCATTITTPCTCAISGRRENICCGQGTGSYPYYCGYRFRRLANSCKDKQALGHHLPTDCRPQARPPACTSVEQSFHYRRGAGTRQCDGHRADSDPRPPIAYWRDIMPPLRQPVCTHILKALPVQNWLGDHSCCCAMTCISLAGERMEQPYEHQFCYQQA